MKNEIIYNKLLEIEKLIALSQNSLMDVKETADFLKTTLHKRASWLRP